MSDEPLISRDLKQSDVTKLILADLPKLSSIGFYYRNDSPTGFGVHFENEDARRMVERLESAYQLFLAKDPDREEFLSRVAWEQLEVAAPEAFHAHGTVTEKRLTRAESYALMNIWTLSREGRMQQDEFNGIIASFNL